MLTNKKISIIVPCYNDVDSVQSMYERVTEVMKKITPQYEIVYVNDASPDNAIETLRMFAEKDKRFVVVDMSRNFGADIAYTAGLAVCTGDAAIMIDGDIQDPPELFPQFVSKWLEGFDIVYGIRKKRRGSWIKRICYKFYYRLFQKLSYLEIPLDAGDFGLIDRKIVNVLNQMPETDRFLRGLRAWVGFRHTGIPYERDERFSGRSASNLKVYFRQARRGIFSFSFVPLEIISMLAVGMVLFSLIALIVYVIMAFFYSAPKGFLTLLVLMLVLGSMQFMCLAVMAEYIGRTFNEAKRRPIYLIQQVYNDPRVRTNED